MGFYPACMFLDTGPETPHAEAKARKREGKERPGDSVQMTRWRTQDSVERGHGEEVETAGLRNLRPVKLVSEHPSFASIHAHRCVLPRRRAAAGRFGDGGRERSCGPF